MSIRAACAQDATAVAMIWNFEIRDGVSTFNSVEKMPTEVQTLIADRKSTFLVAEHEGQVVGFATYSQFRGGVGYARTMEHTIYLSEAVRGLGLGRQLMQRLQDHARSQQVHCLIAGIGAENHDGIAFHAALGFVETGRLPKVGRKFSRWMDLVLMQKNL